MAINPLNSFPAQKIGAATPSFPYGEFQDIIAPQDGKGTPWNRLSGGDTNGFHQALLIEAGIVPNNSPDSVTNPQYVQAIQTIAGKLNQNNVIIGGDFGKNPWQRNPTPGAKTVVWPDYPSRSITHTGCDRFGTFKLHSASPPTGVLTQEKWEIVPTVAQAGVLSTHSLKYEVTTAQPTVGADHEYGMVYIIEGYDFQDIAQREFTLTFYVYVSVPGVYSVSLSSVGPTNQRLTAPFTIDVAEVYQKIVLVIPPSPSSGSWNYTSGRGIAVLFNFLAGADFIGNSPNTWSSATNLPAAHANLFATVGNIFAINLIKIEPGRFATAWKPVLFSETLARCQRYYQKSYRMPVSPGSLTGANEILGYLGSSGLVPSFATAVTMRDSDITGVVYSPFTGLENTARNFSTSSDVAVPASLTNAETNRIDFEVSTGASTGDAILYHYVLDADFKN